MKLINKDKRLKKFIAKHGESDISLTLNDVTEVNGTLVAIFTDGEVFQAFCLDYLNEQFNCEITEESIARIFFLKGEMKLNVQESEQIETNDLNDQSSLAPAQISKV